MALDIKGKAALVTGGGSGICLEFTKRLLAEGCNVLVADIVMRPEVEEKLKTAGKFAKAVYVKTDVTKWDQLQNAFDAAIKEFGTLDIVVPGAGVFEPDISSFWQLNKGADTVENSSFLSIDLNVTHPIRATQLAIDYFMRQKLAHGAVLLISSIAAQLPLLPIPLYTASKHAISGFARSMGHLESTMNIRINAVAPGIVKTPIWSAEKAGWLDESVDSWLPVEKVVDVMVDMITKKEYIGGTVLEVGIDLVRPVEELNDPGPKGRGHTVAKVADGYAHTYALIEQNFGV